jgi:steroid 5-alpha reductase family enzyme
MVFESISLFISILSEEFFTRPEFLTGFITLFILYSIIFLRATFTQEQDDSVVDILWGANAVAYSAIFFVFSSPIYINFVLFFVLSLWGYRLIFAVFDKRKKLNGHEDPRYTSLKKSWSKRFFNIQRFVKIYLLQLILGTLLLLPVMIFMQFTQYYSELQNLIFQAGIFILAIGLFIETLADLQMRDFKKHKSKNQTFCREGLWAYSRHPNYFGESLFWLGVAVVISTQTTFGFVSWIMITFLLLFVSGIPKAEEGFKNDKEYQKYKKEVSSFIPWFVKKHNK